MNWKYIKWLHKQPKVRIVHDTYKYWGGLYDSYKVFIKGKLMHKHYKHPDRNSEIRYDWIEKL